MFKKKLQFRTFIVFQLNKAVIEFAIIFICNNFSHAVLLLYVNSGFNC